MSALPNESWSINRLGSLELFIMKPADSFPFSATYTGLKGSGVGIFFQDKLTSVSSITCDIDSMAAMSPPRLLDSCISGSGIASGFI